MQLLEHMLGSLAKVRTWCQGVNQQTTFSIKREVSGILKFMDLKFNRKVI